MQYSEGTGRSDHDEGEKEGAPAVCWPATFAIVRRWHSERYSGVQSSSEVTWSGALSLFIRQKMLLSSLSFHLITPDPAPKMLAFELKDLSIFLLSLTIFIHAIIVLHTTFGALAAPLISGVCLGSFVLVLLVIASLLSQL
jgi:hypothetical protein